MKLGLKCHGINRGYFGDALGLKWGFGDALGNGDTLEMLWGYSGDTLEVLWDTLGML